MTDPNAPPSANPADETSMAGMLRLAIAKTLQGIDTMLPARVIAYDRERNRATVQPMIMIGTTTGAKVSRAQVAAVPVFQLAGGGFVMTFPLQPGDLGWLKANDRDVSLFLQSLNEEWPNTARSRSFADGVFFPDRLRSFTLDGADADRVVLQSADAAARVSVGADDVRIHAGATTVTVAADGVSIEAPAVDVTAPLTTFNGNVNVTGTLTVGGLPFATHKHAGVSAGTGTSGGPVA